MTYEYRTIDTRTIRGIEAAEKLQADGWKIIRSGLFSIQFERPIRNYKLEWSESLNRNIAIYY